MGLRFRKAKQIAPGLRLNFSKKSVGLSIGKKGLRYSINSSGRRTKSFGIPGTGISYQTYSQAKRPSISSSTSEQKTLPSNRNFQKNVKAKTPLFPLLLLGIFFTFSSILLFSKGEYENFRMAITFGLLFFLIWAMGQRKPKEISPQAKPIILPPAENFEFKI